MGRKSNTQGRDKEIHTQFLEGIIWETLVQMGGYLTCCSRNTMYRPGLIHLAQDRIQREDFATISLYRLIHF